VSDFSDIASALRTAMLTISGIGVVHAYQRWSNTWSDYLDLVDATVPADEVKFWMIRRERVSSEPDEMGGVQRTHAMVVAGAMALDDSANTYATFQDYIESVIETLGSKKDLGLAAVIDYGVGPCSARTIAEEMVGDVLCHVTEIEVPVVTSEAVVYS